MQQEGEHTINTDLESVWQALNDPVMLKASIPGCESFEQIDAENLKRKRGSLSGKSLSRRKIKDWSVECESI